jgi:hypothetical protein
MVTRTFMLQGEADELRNTFLELLVDAGFTLIHREETDDGFTLIGANSKRTSQLVATMMNLFIGYIQRNRFAVEVRATSEADRVHVVLRCCTYLDVLDMEAPPSDPEEHEKCLRLADYFQDKMIEKYNPVM